MKDILISGKEFNEIFPRECTKVVFAQVDEEVEDSFNLAEFGNIKGIVVGTTLYVTSPNVIYANTDCSEMFKGLDKVNAILFDNFNTEDVVNMANMFEGCSSIFTLNATEFNLSNVDTMVCMFKDSSNLRYLGLNCENLRSTTDSKGIFSNCKRIRLGNII